MKRRALLAGLATAGAAGVAGCGAGGLGGGERTATPSPPEFQPEIPDSVEFPVPASELRRAAPRDAIPAVVDPAYGPDWQGVEIEMDDGVYRPRLAGGDQVIGVARDGAARAYPVKLLRWHEAVNDDFGGPLLVTYCPLCRSGVAAVRRVDGEPATFGVSGLLWHENLVLYDEPTDSRWSQLLGAAIRGPKAGTRLELMPSAMTTWAGWRREHPDTEVLLPAPLSGTVVGDVRFNYAVDVYDRLERIWNRYPDEAPGASGAGMGVRARELVVGVSADGVTKAYPFTRVHRVGVVNDRVGDRPVVVAATPGDSLVAYDRRVGGDALRFERGDGGAMVGGGSRWDLATGRALDGPYESAKLQRANAQSPMLWFAWRSFNPDTEVYESG